MAHLNWGTGLDGVTLVVQMGFGYPPATAVASITWTDVTPYVRVLLFGDGKSDVLGTYQAGRLSMVLGNADRRFDPLHATGPYFGNLLPMTPCRVRFTYSGTTVTLWTGFVAGWPQSYNPPRDATVSVNASDGFAVLQRTKMPSLYAVEVAADSPSLWWRLGEQAGIVAVDASGNGNDGSYAGGATFNSRAGLIVDTDNSIHFDYGMIATSVAAFTLPSTNFSIEFWVSNASASNTTIEPHMLIDFGAERQVYAEWGNGHLTAVFGAASATANVDLATGATYHVVAVYTTSGVAPKIYVNGVDVTAASSAGAITPVAAPVTAGAIRFISGGGSLDHGVTLDEFAVYPTALSAARGAVHYSAGVAPFAFLDTGAVASKVLDIAGVPTADRTIETGKSLVASFDMSGKTALQVCQDMERTEQGRFFMAPDGKATFYNRHHSLTTAASTTSQATFGDAAGELMYGDLNSEYSEDRIYNSITTARVNGSPHLVEDAASIVSYREREFSVTGLYNQSDDETRDLGLWLLGRYAQPSTRVPQIVVQPRRSPTTLFPQIRDRRLCDRITVKRRPQNVGAAISFDVVIEGVQHTVTQSPLNWTTTLLLSPAEPSYWILEDPVLGVLDSTTRLAF